MPFRNKKQKKTHCKIFLLLQREFDRKIARLPTAELRVHLVARSQFFFYNED